MYSNIYNLISTYIFGSVTSGSYEELVTILLSSCACIFVFALPFIVVYWVIKAVL